MKGIRNNKFLKNGIIGYIQRIIIVVLMTMTVAFILSLLLKLSFNIVLKYSSFLILIIGALSIIGGNNIMYGSNYVYTKASTGMMNTTKNDLETLKGSYSFCIFMGVSAVILFLIYLIF